MVIYALLAAASAAQAQPPAAPLVRQARASVRIVSGARIEARSIPAEALVREVKEQSAQSSEPIFRIVEFP